MEEKTNVDYDSSSKKAKENQWVSDYQENKIGCSETTNGDVAKDEKKPIIFNPTMPRPAMAIPVRPCLVRPCLAHTCLAQPGPHF